MPSLADAYTLLHRGALELARTERAGIRVDMDYLDRTSARIHRKVSRIEEELKEDPVWKEWVKAFGSKALLTSDVQLGQVLFGRMKVPYPGGEEGKTKTGRYSVDEEMLNAVDLPFTQKLLRMRKLNRLVGTYLKGIKREVVDGFAHCVFNLHLVDTYRSSADSFNIQNQYSRDPEFAELIRKCFIPRHPDWCFAEVDYGALEFCIAASVWDDSAMIEYASDPGKDIHRDTAAELFLCGKHQVSKAMRHVAKNKFVFPILYGSYWVSCARSIWEAICGGLKLEGSDTTVRDHLKAKGYPEVGRLSAKEGPRSGCYESVVRKCEESFYRRFPRFATGKNRLLKDYRETALLEYVTGFLVKWSGRKGLLSVNNLLNSGIQGPGFHCLLWSMTKIGPELRRKRMKALQVAEIHDCILFDAPESELQDTLDIAARVMTQDIRKEWSWIKTPMKVEVDVTPPGGSWDMKKPWVCEGGVWGPKQKKA